MQKSDLAMVGGPLVAYTANLAILAFADRSDFGWFLVSEIRGSHLVDGFPALKRLLSFFTFLPCIFHPFVVFASRIISNGFLLFLFFSRTVILYRVDGLKCVWKILVRRAAGAFDLSLKVGYNPSRENAYQPSHNRLHAAKLSMIISKLAWRSSNNLVTDTAFFAIPQFIGGVAFGHPLMTKMTVICKLGF
jgi:hypothetical protein